MKMTNSQIIRSVYDRWISSRGKDADAWLEIFDDNIEFNSPAARHIPVIPTQRMTRKAAMKPYLDFMSANSELEEYILDRVEEIDDLVIVLGKSCWRMLDSGRLFRSSTANFFWFRDGKVIRFDNFYDTMGLHNATQQPHMLERTRR